MRRALPVGTGSLPSMSGIGGARAFGGRIPSRGGFGGLGGRGGGVLRTPRVPSVNRGGNLIPMPGGRGRQIHNTIRVDIYGAYDTSLALSMWNKEVKKSFEKRKNEIEGVVKKAVQDVLDTGRSKSMNMAPTNMGITQGMRMLRGAQVSLFPFKGTGAMKRSIKVEADSPMTQHRGGTRKPLQIIDITIQGSPEVERRARAIIKGWSQTIDSRHEPWIKMLRARNLPAPRIGATLVAPARDFIQAGVKDSLQQVEKLYNEAILEANAKTTMRIPPLAIGKAYMTKFYSANKYMQMKEVQRGIRGEKVDC